MEWVYGSGVRAAVVLGTEAELLVTVADSQTLPEIESVLGGIPLNAIPRQYPIEFAYDTPLSAPRLHMDPSDRDILGPKTRATDAVVFGMIETQPTVIAERAVLDPQHSLTISQIEDAITADEVVIVANTREVHALARDCSLDNAAWSILDMTGAAALVVKAGALGALVFRRGEDVEGISAVVTPTVFPIGSGDVFTAALAGSYFANGDLIAAARSATWRTAGYVATRQLGEISLENGDLTLTPVPTVSSVKKPPSVYVAASFANAEQRWSLDTIAEGIGDVGGHSINPLRDLGPKENAEETAHADLAALDGCHAIVVLADVARTGPFFEAGWATCRGLPVVVMNSDPDPDRYTMMMGTGAQSVSDLSTAAYHSVWAAIEHQRGTTSTEALILLSGGLDSTAVAAIERPARALFVDYGQLPAEAERTAARAVASHLSLELDQLTVDLSDVGSGILIGAPQPNGELTPEWFPFRNQLLATIGAAHAVKHGLNSVLLGLVAEDSARHADGTRQFVSTLDMVTRGQEGRIRVSAPQIGSSLRELLLASRLPEDVIHQTHSCHTSNVRCEDCPGCHRRQEVLASLKPST